MTAVKNNFTPSVNIERDQDKDLNYVVTSNTRHIFDQIIRNRNTGTHSFTIIGSYGTGKSSFLVALKKNLQEEEINYFEPLNGQFSDINEFKFDFIVGNYISLKDRLADHFELDLTTEEEIFEWIDRKHSDLKEKGIFWFIVVDEFGKHLEYAAKQNPEKELYFVQRLSEYANEEEKNLYFITTLHQAFDSYAHGLDLQQRKEWDKVRGRLKELTFNEPVEQLLYIASEYLSKKETPSDNKSIEQLTDCIQTSRVFPLKNELDVQLAKNLYPLDPLSAAALSLALQKYGQNERSLFTFLESNEYLGINDYDESTNPYYNLSCVYDYLIHNHHHFLTSKYNPHYLQWSSLKKAIERVESHLDEKVLSAKKLVKKIGLLNIFSAEGAKINLDFLTEYASNSMGIENVGELVTELEDKQIIKFRAYKQRFILFEGTDFDIEYELQNATSKVDPITDIVKKLKQHFDFPYIPAKRIYYIQGTPRFFEFKLSEQPIDESPEQPIDGVINLVFDKPLSEVIDETKNSDKPILLGVFNNTNKLKEQLYRIKKIRYVIEEVVEKDDKIAKRELRDLEKFHIDELNNDFLNSIYSAQDNIDWVYNGDEIEISDAKSLNRSLSKICENIYSKAPKFKNELINKEKVSPAIYKPRKKLLKILLEKRNEEFLGFEDDSFPAEKTIYLSLLNETGIHEKRERVWDLREPHSDFEDVWEASEDFFESTKTGKRNLMELIDILRKPPYGLKTGLLELWIPLYLIIKKDNFALFKEGSYITKLTYDVVNLVYRNPKKFEIKAFHISDVKKKIFEKYRSYLDQDETVDFTNESFVETVKPFLLIYNNLTEYGRNTSKISKTAQQLREAIKSATDPEKAFFEQFISALGFVDLKELEDNESMNQFVRELDKSIEEIRTSYDDLVDRIEQCLLDTLGFQNKNYKSYKEDIKSRYDSIKSYKLVPYQKKLLGRLTSEQPDRESWIEAVAFAILDKPLEKIDDEEEPKLLDKLGTRLKELDNLRELSMLNVDPDKQEAFTYKIQSFNKEPLDRNVIIDKKKIDKESDRYQNIKKLLTDDKETNLALLIRLIEDQSNNE